ncbi:MAG: DUF4382 domain-containing protein [Symploca sp. SIO2E6]|nr:DUF4382 domain-containing protein [Symploca sp. SIO2E6]
MSRQLLTLANLTFVATGLLFGCSQGENQDETPVTQEQGKLEIRANGEDFIREGFVSKDDWQISFDHVYVNLADITAYQTDPPFHAEANSDIQIKEEVSFEEAKTVDLAEGDESAEPILVQELAEAPAGKYNALAWKMVKGESEPTEGQTLVMEGKAKKEEQTIDFTLKIDQEYEYICGEFVGGERKGILETGGAADLELTFHFDHVFGDADASADDDTNTNALGFKPLAALAEDGKLEVEMSELESQLSAKDYEKLEKALMGLGHVGEGHCQDLTTTDTKN